MSSAQGVAPASSPSSGWCGGRHFGAADGGDSSIGGSRSLGQQACFFSSFWDLIEGHGSGTRRVGRFLGSDVFST